MSESAVKVTVKLFAIYQEAFGKSDLTLTFPPATPVSAILNILLEQQPQLEQWRGVTRYGLNLKFVEADTILQDGDEVVLIPPVSGG